MRIEGSTPLWLAARALLVEKGDAFFDLLQRAGRDSRVEVIHDLRVASRRLREAIALFAPCYPAEALIPLRRKIRRVTGALGELRNQDEAFLFLSRLASRLEPQGREFLAGPLARCRERCRGERERLQPALAVWQDGALARRFYRIAGKPILFAAGSDHTAFLPVADFARSALDPRGTEMVQLLLSALREEAIEAQHRLRIAVKHYRYRAEIFSPLYNSDSTTLHGRLKGYQEELGKMHDLDVVTDLLVTEEYPSPGREAVLAAIAAERHEHFLRFIALNQEMPLPDVAEGLRRLL